MINFKNYLYSIITVLLLTLNLKSQCNLTYYAGIGVPSSGTTFATWSNYGPGQYFAMPLLYGGSYAISTCGAPITTQLTGWDNSASSVVFYNAGNGPLCSGNNASVDNYVPNFTGYAYVQVTENACSAGGSSSINLYLRQNNNLSFTSSGAAICSGQSRSLSATPANVGSTPGGYGDPGTFSGTGVSGNVFTAPYVSSPTNYTITYTFGYVSQNQVITVNPLPTVGVSTSSATICQGQSTTLNGTGASTYTWTGGVTNGVAFAPSTSATYYVTGTSLAGCTSTNSASQLITVNPNPTVSITSSTNVSCNGGANGAISVSATGGSGFSYDWLPGNPTGDGTASISGLSSATYSCFVTNSAGCTATSNSVNITQPTAISITAASQTNVSCNGGSNGAASVNVPTGGAGGFTYNWTPGNPTGDGTASVTGLTAGTWSCTVTDANSCTKTQTFNVTQPTAISLTAASQTNVSCNGSSNGAASVNVPTGGAGGFTYDWTPGNPTGDGTTSVTGLTAGTWSCTVTDANSCTRTQTFNVTQPTAISLTAASQTNVSCNGGSNGAASVNVPTGGAGGFIYNWTPGNPTGDGTASVTGLTAGNWTCTTTDANGCTAFTSFNVTQPVSALGTSTAVTNVACFGNSTGAATVTATGGTSGYTYLWSTGATTSVITSQSSGTKSYTVTDANSCTTTGNVFVSQPASALATSTTVSNVLCNGGSTGSASVTAIGGTAGYTYLWSTGATTSVVASQTSGVKTVTVTDANGCISINSVSIIEPTLLTAIISQTNTTCNGVCDGAATVTSSGGSAPYMFNWSNGGTAFTENGLCAGSYTVDVTDDNGCNLTQTITITEPSAISVSALSGNILCNGGATSVTVTANGGTGALNGTGVFTETAGTYTYMVSDANSCSANTVITISEPTAISVSAISGNILCNGGSTSVTVTANGGTGAYTGTGVFAETAGTYTYNVTDANSCAATTSIVVNEPVAIAASQTVTLCNGQSLTIGSNTYTSSGTFVDVLQSQINGCDSTLTTVLIINQAIDVTTNLSGLTITANENSATYQWIDCDNANQPISGETNQSFTASSNGNYAVIVTQNSCSDTSACVNISTVGLKENTTINSVSIYPNPSNGTYNISGLAENSKIVVYDAVGRIVYSTITKEFNETISILDAPNGVYMIQINSIKGVITKKVIKKD
ncbi:MAG: T9SS type A sorting domain-containing protein [Bacteroidetes bacterium]|nr:T9SS type A sorting domain-containing protein [Bacteroidota bacterium]